MARFRLPVAMLLTALSFPSSAAAVIRVVDGDGKATATDCDSQTITPFGTIQSAVNAATAGVDTVQVCPGTYSELVTVNKSLVVNGPRAGIDANDASRTGLPATEAVVTGTGSGASQTTAFHVTASTVTIDGFTAEGVGDANNLGSVIVLDADLSAETIQNNIVQDGLNGLTLGSNQTTIRHNLFKHNVAGDPDHGHGIGSDEIQANGAITGVTIDGNRFDGNNFQAIDLASSSLHSQSDFTISNNTFSGNAEALSARNLIGSSFTGNTVTGSSTTQIAILNGVVDLDISENVVANGVQAGVMIRDGGGGQPVPTQVTVRCNSITGNHGPGLDAEPAGYSGKLDARFNWWGDPNGPKFSATGLDSSSIFDPDGVSTSTPFLVDGTDGNPAAPGFQCGTKASIGDVAQVEGNGGTTAFDFTVTLTNPSPAPVSIDFATADGTAVAGADYASSAGTLTFAAGERTKTISVPVVGDTVDEPDEAFGVKLLSPAGATIADGEALGTIQDDDLPPPPLLDTRPPVIGAAVIKGPKLRKALKRGFKVRVTSDEAGPVTIAAKVGRKVVARGKATLAAPGTKRVAVKFTKKAKGKFKRKRRLKLAVNVDVSDLAGNNTFTGLTATLKR